MTIDPLLELLRDGGRRSSAELAEQLSMAEEKVRFKIEAWEEDGTIRGYHAVVDPEVAREGGVSAFIEVKLAPERGGGFDRLGRRIARFEQVSSCHLFSGTYDLMVVVEGNDLMEIAQFVAEKLSTLDGVLSTATHFQLKTYKKNGFLFGETTETKRLPVSP